MSPKHARTGEDYHQILKRIICVLMKRWDPPSKMLEFKTCLEGEDYRQFSKRIIQVQGDRRVFKFFRCSCFQVLKFPSFRVFHATGARRQVQGDMCYATNPTPDSVDTQSTYSRHGVDIESTLSRRLFDQHFTQDCFALGSLAYIRR